jgi:hypothetical protein
MQGAAEPAGRVFRSSPLHSPQRSSIPVGHVSGRQRRDSEIATQKAAMSRRRLGRISSGCGPRDTDVGTELLCDRQQTAGWSERPTSMTSAPTGKVDATASSTSPRECVRPVSAILSQKPLNNERNCRVIGSSWRSRRMLKSPTT